MSDFAIRHAGDAAVVIDFQARLDPAINARAVQLARAIRESQQAGLRDVVVGYHSVTVYVDPSVIAGNALDSWLAEEAGASRGAAPVSDRTVEVPVVYGGAEGPDLGAVAQFAGCSERDVVRLHSGQTYRVYMLGFVPGFAYLAAVETRIAAPRRQTPRVAVPAGSVGIAGPQTGVYPMQTPGGWNLIGRTPLVIFDPGRAEPCVFKPGDAVRFQPLDRWPG
ncbi:MAG TPA: 5-oxoprolinase subunit PxpB [Vicinamibacterales bacterium]|jgi:KipI family sensor histidine kinase inhibitor|nr:5-oxoprolinase subunit PxpB [Vicinamibacterales bacterium]